MLATVPGEWQRCLALSKIMKLGCSKDASGPNRHDRTGTSWDIASVHGAGRFWTSTDRKPDGATKRPLVRRSMFYNFKTCCQKRDVTHATGTSICQQSWLAGGTKLWWGAAAGQAMRSYCPLACLDGNLIGAATGILLQPRCCGPWRSFLHVCCVRNRYSCASKFIMPGVKLEHLQKMQNSSHGGCWMSEGEVFRRSFSTDGWLRCSWSDSVACNTSNFKCRRKHLEIWTWHEPWLFIIGVELCLRLVSMHTICSWNV